MTELTSRQATMADINAVLSDLSEQTLAEFRAIRQSPRRFVAEAANFGQRIWVCAGDQPLALFAFEDQGPHCSMWFIASATYFGSPAFVRSSARGFRRLGHQKPIVCTTFSPHPDVERWYRIMGFEMVLHEGQMRQFIFQP